MSPSIPLACTRAVADFPNIIYVLSYDPVVMGQTLTKAVQVQDGAAYLEKIVQVSFRVPRPEAFDLRRWFQAEVHKLFAPELRASPAGNQNAVTRRLAQVIDVNGGRYLETGRDVVRVLNALRLHAIPVRTQIDVADMVWLQLVKIGNPEFYCWVEEYLVEVAAIANGASVSGSAVHSMALRLETILKALSQDILLAVIELSEILPGVETATAEPGKIVLFNNIKGSSIEPLVASRRLGSPQHYRYYFAFSEPAGAVSDQQVQAFIATAEQSSASAVRMFVNFSRIARPQGGTLAEVVIDRVNAWSDRIPEEPIPGILMSLAQTINSTEFSATGDFGRRPAWELATRAVKVLLRRTSGLVRATSLRVLFTEGQALLRVAHACSQKRNLLAWPLW